MSSSKSLSRKIWIVPIENEAAFREDQVENIKNATIDPSTVEDWPNWMDIGHYLLVDQVIPQAVLALGVNEFCITVSDTTKVKHNKNKPLESGTASTALDDRPRSSSPMSPAPAPKDMDPPPCRVLTKRSSQTEEEAAEQIAEDTKEDFTRNELLSTATKSVTHATQHSTSSASEL